MITKFELDTLAEKYETSDFIKSDPVQFIHRYDFLQDVEIVAFLSSLFAFGSRKVFIKKLEELFLLMGKSPYDFILNGDIDIFSKFDYRFAKPEDVKNILLVLRKFYSSANSLEDLFEYGYKQDNTIKSSMIAVSDYFYSNVKAFSSGFSFMIAQPRKGGAMKRMNMFLRWMIRKSSVDKGVWTFIMPSELLIPLDVHVANVSRKMGLLARASNDFKAVLELTERLKEFDFEDPIKYDFAMFGAGVEGLYKD